MLSKELLRSLLFSMHLCNPFYQAFRFHRGVFTQSTLPANTSFIRSVPTLLQSASASSYPQYALNSILPFSASFSPHTAPFQHLCLFPYLQKSKQLPLPTQAHNSFRTSSRYSLVTLRA